MESEEDEEPPPKRSHGEHVLMELLQEVVKSKEDRHLSAEEKVKKEICKY